MTIFTHFSKTKFLELSNKLKLHHLFQLGTCALMCSMAVTVGVAAQDEEAISKNEMVAHEKFENGNKLYLEGDFRGAVEMFEEAYDLHEEPMILHNIARAKETYDPEGAIEAYEQYLDTGSAEEVEFVHARIKAMEVRVAELDAHKKAEAERDAAVQAVAEKKSVSEGPLPWIVFGGGVALVGTGLLFGALANGKHNAAVMEPTHETAFALQGTAENFAVVANVLMIGGGVLALVGLIWGIAGKVGGKSDSDVSAFRLTPSLSPSLAGLSASGTF